MHRQVDWMTPADPVVLRFLHSARTTQGDPAVQTPKTIGLNTGYSREHASKRAKALAEHGLVEQVGLGEYRLTERGAAVIDNEIALEELNEGDES